MVADSAGAGAAVEARAAIPAVAQEAAMNLLRFKGVFITKASWWSLCQSIGRNLIVFCAECKGVFFNASDRAFGTG